MRLKKRVWLVIIPVLVIGYAAVLFGIYQAERRSYLNQQQARLELTLSQLRSHIERYSSFADVMFANVMQSTALNDALRETNSRYRAYSIEQNMGRVISDLFGQDFNTFNFAIMDSKGELHYFYIKGEDPFAEIRSELTDAMQMAFKEKRAASKFIRWQDKESLFVRMTIIHPYTLRAPISGQWEEAYGIGMLFDIKAFDKQRSELADQGITISIETGDESAEKHSKVHSFIRIADLLTIHADISDEVVDAHLFAMATRFFLIFLLLCAASAGLLIFLIERYITGPVLRLESMIREAEQSSGELVLPTHGNDEISALADTFTRLHNQQLQNYRRTRELADIDTLTHLKNRRKFNECVEDIISRSPKQGHIIGLLYIDLDNFKFVNDNYGHEAGDQVLLDFSERLQSTLRSGDVVLNQSADLSRLAGDEFAVLMDDLPSETTLATIAQRVLDIFTHGFSCNIGNFPISASIGIALFPRDGENARTLIASADAAMYQAKNAGKNQYAFYSAELAQTAKRHQSIEAALKLRDFSEFSMYYQLIVDAATGDAMGAEALIRWTSAELGFVSPAEFIPIAESRGLSMAIDLWVLKRVSEDLPALLQIMGSQSKVGINISSAQLESEEFFFLLMQLMTENKVPRESIVLEITETFAAEMSKRVAANLNLLKQAGFHLSLDDFGAGYTSLLQLMNYPITTIKIDKLLVDRLEDDGREFVPALIKFCKQQGLRVTAEGVETASQAELLVMAGVDTLQGYHFAKPVALTDLPTAVKGLNGKMASVGRMAHDA